MGSMRYVEERARASCSFVGKFGEFPYGLAGRAPLIHVYALYRRKLLTIVIPLERLGALSAGQARSIGSPDHEYSRKKDAATD